MRNISIVLIIFYSTLSLCQENGFEKFSTEMALSPDGINFSSSDFFDNRIKNKRIVLLGELDHGDGTSFEVKTELVKYLHKEHGFNTLVFEAGLIDCNELWDSKSEGFALSDLAKKHIFYIWSQTQETKALFKYLDENSSTANPLRIVGIDPQFSGNENAAVFINSLKRVLDDSEVAGRNFEEFSSELELIGTWLKYPGSSDHILTESEFYSHLDYFKQKVLSTVEQDEISKWELYFENVKTLALLKWKKRGGAFEQRDAQMFKNLEYWVEQNEKDKFIVWAANAHIIRNDDRLKGKDSNYEIIGLKKLGDHVHEAYAEVSYSIGIAAGKGKTLNYIDKKKRTKIGKHSRYSLEGYLRKYPMGFVDLLLFEQTMSVTEYESQLFYPNLKCISKWSDHFDSIIYIPEMKPSTALW